jgi:hypothetical protein
VEAACSSLTLWYSIIINCSVPHNAEVHSVNLENPKTFIYIYIYIYYLLRNHGPFPVLAWIVVLPSSKPTGPVVILLQELQHLDEILPGPEPRRPGPRP